jgi:predicted TIM-barrel fold metal-dependent hydrolase
MSGWIRKPAWDAATDGFSPIPTRLVSNEEYAPLSQSPEQARVAALLHATATRHAKRLGVSRRAFLGSSAGMAAAFLALNRVFGHYFAVDPVEALEVAAADASKPVGQFVFDIQTHHVAERFHSSAILQLRRGGRRLNSELQKDRGTMEDVYLENYLKEVFLDSDTDVAVLSGIPAASEANDILPPNQLAKTRDLVNRLTASRRLVAHGVLAPNKGPSELDEMRRQAEQLKIGAWKVYTGLTFSNAPKPWRIDDEKVGYPMLDTARRLGIRNVCLHKGLPLQATGEEFWHPRDIERAATDYPDINFIVYHAGFRAFAEWTGATLDRFVPPARVDWVTDLCEIRRRNPKLTNVYAELGSTLGGMVVTSPLLCGHVLGMLVQSLGADHVLWGTDAIWWGSPQWQIEAFRRYTMPDVLMQRFGYAPLTVDVKTQILGLNAAKIYGIDPKAHRNPMPPDYIARMKAAYLHEGPAPSLTQYGWVRA